MKDLNFNETLNNIFREEFPYLIYGMSRFKTTKIELPRVLEGEGWSPHTLFFDKRTNAIHAPGNSSSVDFEDCFGFNKADTFIDRNGYGYSFKPLFGHKHINQDLLLEFINIVKDYTEIRNRHSKLLCGDNYCFDMDQRSDHNNPFQEMLTIYEGKEIVFCNQLADLDTKKRLKLINESGYKDLINSLENSFYLIHNEYKALYNRIKAITTAFKLIEKL